MPSYVEKEVPCDLCDGKGRCGSCKGSGEQYLSKCTLCSGDGVCFKCHGRGRRMDWVEEQRRPQAARPAAPRQAANTDGIENAAAGAFGFLIGLAIGAVAWVLSNPIARRVLIVAIAFYLLFFVAHERVQQTTHWSVAWLAVIALFALIAVIRLPGPSRRDPFAIAIVTGVSVLSLGVVGIWSALFGIPRWLLSLAQMPSGRRRPPGAEPVENPPAPWD